MAELQLDVIRFDLSKPSDNTALLELIKQLRHYPHDLLEIVDVRNEQQTVAIDPEPTTWRKQTRERHLRTNRILRLL